MKNGAYRPSFYGGVELKNYRSYRKEGINERRKKEGRKLMPSVVGRSSMLCSLQ